MYLRIFMFVCLVCIDIICLPKKGNAAFIRIEESDLRPLYTYTLTVELSGQIVLGDTDALLTKLSNYDLDEVTDVLFLFDSPGGSLLEGLKLGKVIARLSPRTAAQVGHLENRKAICASACVFAYLGSNYRYRAFEGRIGVHRFSAPDAQFSDGEALALGQVLSSTIIDFITEQRVDPELFSRMSSTSFDGIDWIEAKVLEEWRVVTNDIYSESSEYRNVNGKLALELVHESRNGQNRLTLICGGNGLVGLASLHEPEVAAYGTLELVIDGVGVRIEDWNVIKRADHRATIGFQIPNNIAATALYTKTFGARVVVPAGGMFFGFEQHITDTKLRDTINGCLQSLPVPTPSMIEWPRTDIVGGDMTIRGIKGISFLECKRGCEADSLCLGVSYVRKKSWCWPKSSISGSRKNSGVISATKN